MGSELSKNYADKAMFTAEAVTSKTPKVYMLNASPDPLGAIAAMNEMYKGRVIRNLDEVTDELREETWADVQRTILKAPLEAVSLHFMVEGVTRAFTHQMVRQRTAVYAQESMRFAVKENATEEVALPPSLMGVKPHNKYDQFSPDPTSEQAALDVWVQTMDDLGDAYNRLIELGMPAEDARGLLPTNILTRIHYVTNLRNLLDHSGVRLCTQAQFEWRLFWASLVEAMRSYATMPGSDNPYNRVGRLADNWQWQRISTIFRPICYQTGKCEFMSNIDRHCNIRDRVNANHDINRPSSEWRREYDPFEDPLTSKPGVGTRASGVVRGVETNKPVFIGPIKTGEWMADPAAARKR